MKQILLTRNQLDRIIAEENGKLAAKKASASDDFIMGLLITTYVCDLSTNILNRLFGAEDENDKEDLLKWGTECSNKLNKMLEDLDDGKHKDI